MLKQAPMNLSANRFADAAMAASRKVWLAGLGAAVVTRDWAQNEAGAVFRTLVKEGSAVESRAIRVIGNQLESSIAVAGTLWNRARRTVVTTVNAVAETAVTALPRYHAPMTAKHTGVAAKARRAFKSPKAAGASKRGTARHSKRSAKKPA
jgi:hypothetical protein